MEATFFATPGDFRAWLEAHRATETELWVGFHKKATGTPSITWPEAVDEALCFGWIDGVRKSLGTDAYVIRFTPRKPTSIWSAVNIARVEALTREGRMHPAGLATFARRDDAHSRRYSYERESATLDDEMLRQFQANERAWAFFAAQPPGYRRTAAWWVISAKRPETRQKRLDTLIADSEAGRVIAVLARPQPKQPPQE